MSASRGKRRTRYSLRWRKWAGTCISNIFKRSGKRAEFSIDQILEILPVNCPCCNKIMQCGLPYNNSPTIDRLDNDEGYTLKNIWVICHRCNSIKRDCKSPNKLYAIADAWWDRIFKCK